MAFYNFLWGRYLNSDSITSRISRQHLYMPIECGGFGMIHFERVLEGIYCLKCMMMNALICLNLC